MGNSKTCPICNKSDIPNFLTEDVVCPCCGSDLSIYHKIDILTNVGTSPKTIGSRKCPLGVTIIICFLLISSIGLLCLYNNTSSKPQQLTEELECLKKKNTELSVLNAELSDSIATLTKRAYKPYDWYVIKKGDSFCRISKQIYGTEAKYRYIVQLNNLTESTVLFPGDSLRIK